MSKYELPELNELARMINLWAQRAGFHEKVRPFDGMMMNIVTEVAEAQEEWRNGRHYTETYWTVKQENLNAVANFASDRDGVYVRNPSYGLPGPEQSEWLRMTPELLRSMPDIIPLLKPEGIPSELADIIIRALHVAAYFGIDISAAIADKMAYNESRPYRNGGKLS